MEPDFEQNSWVVFYSKSFSDIVSQFLKKVTLNLILAVLVEQGLTSDTRMI